MKPCRDTTHGPVGSEVLPKVHHHNAHGHRVGHSRFGACIFCGLDWPLYDAPTLAPQPGLFGEVTR